MANSGRNLRGLILGSVDVQKLTGWPPSMIEDYLSLRDNFVTVTDEADLKQDRLRKIYNVSSTPYTVPADADVLFIDTDLIDITINLRPGVGGTHLRMINTGTSGNDAHITPSGSELLFGTAAAEILYDFEVFVIDYSTVYGWF